MTNDQLVLQVNKINISPDKTYVKYNQNERGKVIDINVIDNDGINAYDLTNKKIRFVDEKEDNKLIIDDEADNPSHFTRANDTQGKFSYTFHDLVYQRSGIARFEIYTDSEHIDATANFEIQIENMTSTVVANESYISSFEGLVAHYHNTVNTTVSETQQLINSLTDKINRAISNGQNDVANELSDARAKLQQITTDANNLKNSWNAEFETEKQNFTDLQNQWKAQTAKINQDANSQIKAINDNAAQQLKNNQSANDAAIKEVNGQRDAAINQANTNFQNELNKLQQDYNAWKAEKLADFTKSLQSLTDQISTDQADLTNFNKQLSDTKIELANMAKQLDSIDFARFVTGDQFKEAMSKKASGIKVRGLRGDYVMAVNANDSNIDATPSTQQAGLVDSGVLAAAVQALADAILDKNHYTKQEVDGIKQNILDTITNKTKDMATTQDVAANAQRITALENAGFAKIKLDGFSTADDAKKWSADNNGIAMFADEPETV